MTKARVAKSVFIITVFYFLSLLVNMAVQIILASRFGAGAEMDSYFVALTIPTFVSLILSTSISRVFIPVFIDSRLKKGEDSAWKFASNFVNTLSLFLALLVVISLFFIRSYIKWLAPGLSLTSHELSVGLSLVLFPSIFFNGFSTLLTSLYYADNRFLKPSVTIILNSAVIFLMVFLSGRSLGIYSVAYGMILGAVIQSLFLLPVFSGKYRCVLRFDDGDLKKILKLILPVMIGAVFYKATTLIEKNFASGISTGAISYLGYAYRIIPVLLALTTTGISTAFFPLLSKFASSNDWENVKKTYIKGINSLMIIASPIVIYLIIMRLDVIRLLYARGQFTSQDSLNTASVFVYYLIALFFMALSTLPSQIYVITQDTKVLIPIGIFEIIAYSFYCSILSKAVRLQGIAIAFAIYYLIAFSINYFFLYIRIKNLSIKEIFLTPAKIFSVALCSGLVLYYLNVFLHTSAHGPFTRPVFLALTGVLSISLYFVFMHYLKIEEVGEVKRMILSKFKKERAAAPIFPET